MKLAELAALCGARLVAGSSQDQQDLLIEGVAPLENAGADQCAFYANPKYKKELLSTGAGAVIVSADDVALLPRGAVALIAAQPYVAFAKASAAFFPPPKLVPGIMPGALVHATAQIDPTTQIFPGAQVGPNAIVGAQTIVRPGVQILAFAKIGANCLLHAGAIVRERCVIGDRVILQPNCVIGSDGFGFAFDLEGDGDGPIHRKIPQAGIVRIEDDVEVGACACIDRATLGETLIGRGTKIDNLVQIAHNVQIGPLSLIVAQAGISGSTTLGAGVVLAGQVGVVGHLTIGDGARIGAQSGVSRDVPEGATMSGSPAIDHREWLRLSATLPKLAELVKEVKRLGARVAELEGP
jgi:UDP-3-O-[3-hydroxymyristoyl] glucosamine N-acyltransferase